MTDDAPPIEFRLVVFGAAALLDGLVLLGIVRLFPRLLDLTVPPRRDLLPRLGALALVRTGLAYVPWAGWVLPAAATFLPMGKWFDADLTSSALTLAPVAAAGVVPLALLMALAA